MRLAMTTDTRIPSQILRAARGRIANLAHWCSAAYARTAKGRRLENARSPRAVAWCGVGAIYAEDETFRKLDRLISILPTNHLIARTYLIEACAGLYHQPLIYVNDDLTLGHPAILSVYAEAIRLAETDEMQDALPLAVVDGEAP